jgi:hypothetical protein
MTANLWPKIVVDPDIDVPRNANGPVQVALMVTSGLRLPPAAGSRHDRGRGTSPAARSIPRSTARCRSTGRPDQWWASTQRFRSGRRSGPREPGPSATISAALRWPRRGTSEGVTGRGSLKPFRTLRTPPASRSMVSRLATERQPSTYAACPSGAVVLRSTAARQLKSNEQKGRSGG